MKNHYSRRLIALLAMAFSVALTVKICSAANVEPGADLQLYVVSHERNRKLLNGEFQPTRANGNDKCSRSNIVISQGPTAPLPSGIPTYTVRIMNICASGCEISNLHLSCGWFSSARTINPTVFKRIGYDDCIVNGGEPIASGNSISFQYANSFPYRLSISSFSC